MDFRRAVAFAMWLLCPMAQAQPVDVQVLLQGDKVVLDVSASVAAEREQVWAVLTDYEHMAGFVSNLKSSAVIGHDNNALQVEQSGEARHGLLHFAFHSVRSVELVAPQEIRSHLVSGDFKSYEATTRLIVEDGGRTRIAFHGEYVPNRWVPPGIGPSLIRSETGKQYDELIAEIRRRKNAAVPPAAPASAP
ncbi:MULTISPECIES: SRPBCC family protein [unclassified Rhizobacter]|uniref:SRPBCC family protein n=1 Tax=unclassified Rhizobacter TaxID=2640088 RepID=UPI0009EC0379|nr:MULTISPECIES: SRPBCC family protein [unclassified Rhizobacter]